jgi:hypothetical protein
VEDSTALWEAWLLAKAYRKTPSELYFIHDEVAAWCFNRAVYMFGSELDAELQAAGDGAKNQMQAQARRQRVMSLWLGAPQQFKDPTAQASGTISSKGSGPVAI